MVTVPKTTYSSLFQCFTFWGETRHRRGNPLLHPIEVSPWTSTSGDGEHEVFSVGDVLIPLLFFAYTTRVHPPCHWTFWCGIDSCRWLVSRLVNRIQCKKKNETDMVMSILFDAQPDYFPPWCSKNRSLGGTGSVCITPRVFPEKWSVNFSVLTV